MRGFWYLVLQCTPSESLSTYEDCCIIEIFCIAHAVTTAPTSHIEKKVSLYTAYSDESSLIIFFYLEFGIERS